MALRLYRTLLLKNYFDKGFGLTNYFKYGVLLFGWGTGDIRATLWVTFFYMIFCFIVGWTWYKFKIIETENEIANHFNPFQVEVRKKLSGGNLASDFAS